MRVNKRPNLLLITTDQHRGDCMGYAGHPLVETPNLDMLAGEGCRFTSAYSSVPVCIPARMAIMTGLSPWSHGILSMSGYRKFGHLNFPSTLPRELSRAGYHTQAIGKMHFIPQRARYGFDHMVLDDAERPPSCDYREWFAQNKNGPYGHNDHGLDMNSWLARPSHLPEHLHPTWWTASEGIRFLRNRDPMQPFFMWLSFDRPHAPFDPPLVYDAMYQGQPDIPSPYEGEWSRQFRRRNPNVNANQTCLSDRETRRSRAAYYGSITFIDHQIGRLLIALRNMDREELDNTFIIFTSDHGEMLGDHHHWRKNLPWQGSVHVPMFIRYPKTWDLPRGITCDRLVEMRDVMPTLLAAAQTPIPDFVEGANMLNAPNQEVPWREWIMTEYPSGRNVMSGWQSGVSTTEKYIWFHHTGEEMLFNLVNDHGETKNLVELPEYAETLAQWRRRLAKENEKRGDPRGKNSKLVVQPPQKKILLSPNFKKWQNTQ